MVLGNLVNLARPAMGISFDREHCLIQERKTGKELGIGIRYGGLWYLDPKEGGKFFNVAPDSRFESLTYEIAAIPRLGSGSTSPVNPLAV